MPTATKRGTIGAIMTKDPVRVDGATTASELAVILAENEISGVPVVDGQDRVIGVVSRTDLLQQCVTGPPGAGPGTFLTALAEGFEGEIDTATLGVVSDFMNTEPVTAKVNESVTVVARRMAKERVHRVVIVGDAMQVLGLVTSLDLLAMIE